MAWVGIRVKIRIRLKAWFSLVLRIVRIGNFSFEFWKNKALHDVKFNTLFFQNSKENPRFLRFLGQVRTRLKLTLLKAWFSLVVRIVRIGDFPVLDRLGFLRRVWHDRSNVPDCRRCDRKNRNHFYLENASQTVADKLKIPDSYDKWEPGLRWLPIVSIVTNYFTYAHCLMLSTGLKHLLDKY